MDSLAKSLFDVTASAVQDYIGRLVAELGIDRTKAIEIWNAVEDDDLKISDAPAKKSAAKKASAAAAPAKRAAPAAVSIGTMTGETIALVNPQKNYAQFLLRALLPMIIHVVITLAAGYSVARQDHPLFHEKSRSPMMEYGSKSGGARKHLLA